MNTLFVRTITIATLFTLLLCSGMGYADEPDLVAVGYYDANSEIRLVDDIFKTHFSGGQLVNEIKIQVINDFVYVSRKGYAGNGECFTEIAPLVDKFAQPISVGSDPAFCSSVYISTFFPVRFLSCKDDGCHMLEGIGPLGGESLIQDARCDTTELSNNQCRCHINRGQGQELLNSDLLCKTELNVIPMHFNSWVNDTRKRVHSIDHCAQQ